MKCAPSVHFSNRHLICRVFLVELVGRETYDVALARRRSFFPLLYLGFLCFDTVCRAIALLDIWHFLIILCVNVRNFGANQLAYAERNVALLHSNTPILTPTMPTVRMGVNMLYTDLTLERLPAFPSPRRVPLLANGQEKEHIWQ
jgi:hypothetical protein